MDMADTVVAAATEPTEVEGWRLGGIPMPGAPGATRWASPGCTTDAAPTHLPLQPETWEDLDLCAAMILMQRKFSQKN